MEDISGDLERFDNDFKPGDGQRPGLASLPDGEYDFRIVSAVTARTGKTKDPIVRVTLQVLTKGPHYGNAVERAYFLKTLENAEIIGSDLVTLGIDADKWRAEGRKFSTELPLALAKIVGRCFTGKKSSKPKDPKTPNKKYHNLFIKERIAAPADFPPLPDGGAGGNNTPPASEGDEDIPF